jgi:glutamine synthetase adenylyltransferase
MQPNTFEVVAVLAAAGILKKRVAEKITGNLSSMRQLETFIRLNSEAQDFVLPTEAERLQLIAAAMHLGSPRRLRSSVQRLRKENRKLMMAMLKSIPR